MSHECPDCGTLCYCDLEDAYNEDFPIEDCIHWHSAECKERVREMTDEEEDCETGEC